MISFHRKSYNVKNGDGIVNSFITNIRRNNLDRFLQNLSFSGYKYLPKETKIGREFEYLEEPKPNFKGN